MGNILRDQITWSEKNIKLDKLTNKILYKSLVDQKKEESIGVNKWIRILEIDDVIVYKNIFFFIFRYLKENKLIMFRWKLLQCIIPTQKLLCQWKIERDCFCKFCGQEEDYFHYFLTCSFLDNFWKDIYELLKKKKINIRITLKYPVFGYKIYDEEYFGLNYFLSI